MSEAVITVTYENNLTKLERRSVSYCNTYSAPKSVAEDFERSADQCVKYVSDLLAHQYGGRAGPNDPPAIKRPLSNRQKVELVQEIIDRGGWTSKQVLDKIREALKR